MMTISEITEIRKGGECERAYTECQELYADAPDDGVVRSTMARCVKSMLEMDAKMKNCDQFLAMLEEFAALKVWEVGDHTMANRLAWDVKALFENLKYEPEKLVEEADKVFEAVKRIEFSKPDKYYSLLLESFMKVKGAQSAHWKHFGDFMDWWGFDNFLPDDYHRIQLKNNRSIMSVAERAYISYYKSLTEQLAEGICDEARIEAFVARLDEHPEYQYSLYHKSSLYMALGKKEEAISSIRSYFMRKDTANCEYWVWEFLSDVVEDDEVKLSCLCRALVSKADTKFLGKCRRKIAKLMVARGELANAKFEIDTVANMYETAGWHVPADVRNMLAEEWYGSTESVSSNRDYYKAHLKAAEEYIYADSPETAILVVHYNEAKQTCSFVTANEKHGFFLTKRVRIPLEDGQVLKVRFGGEICSDGPTGISTCRIDSDRKRYDNIFFRQVKGKLKKMIGRAFGFVDNVFVAPELLGGGFQHGDDVEADALLSYNLKKEEFCWTARSLAKV